MRTFSSTYQLMVMSLSLITMRNCRFILSILFTTSFTLMPIIFHPIFHPIVPGLSTLSSGCWTSRSWTRICPQGCRWTRGFDLVVWRGGAISRSTSWVKRSSSVVPWRGQRWGVSNQLWFIIIKLSGRSRIATIVSSNHSSPMTVWPWGIVNKGKL